MNRSIVPALSALVLASGLFYGPTTLQAQANRRSSAAHRSSTIISGCLHQGDEAGEYSMRTADGKLYGLTGRKVALKQHVGHEVILHGYVTPESAESGGQSEPAAKAPDAGDIDMTVTSLKMIRATCQ